MKKPTKTTRITLGLFALCIAAFSAGHALQHKSAPPRRVVFDTPSGAVVYPHSFHTAKGGAVEAECTDCHHEYDAKTQSKPQSCRSCHYYGDEKARSIGQKDPLHKRAIGASCMNCHDKECGICHRI